MADQGSSPAQHIDRLRDRLRGVIAATITPFNADLSLDEGGIRANLEFLLDEGVRVLVPCGTIGEAPSLSVAERMRVVELTARTVAGRATVVAGTLAHDLPTVVALARHAAAVGADGVMVPPPSAFKTDAVGILDFYRGLDDRAGVPFLLYNNPAAHGGEIPLDTIAALAELEHFVGVKEASGDVVRFYAAMRRFSNRFPIIAAVEPPLVFTLLCGSPALLTATAVFAPRFMADLFTAASRRNVECAFALYDRLYTFRQLLEPEIRAGFPAYVPWTKAALECRGLAGGPSRPPVRTLDATERARLAQVLCDNDLITALSPVRQVERTR